MKEFFKEFNFEDKIKIQFEARDSDKNAVKYLLPALAFVQRKGICFSLVSFIWNKRFVMRFILNIKKADLRFNFRKRVK